MDTRKWIDLIPEEDKVTYRRAGFSGAGALGNRPALIVVDVTFGFTGSRSLTLEQAIEEFPTACGPASWEAMPRIAALIDLFRRTGRQIIFTNSDSGAVAFTGKATKSRGDQARPERFNEFPSEIAPTEGEWVIGKTKASCFFGTPLAIHLVRAGIDSLVVCGVSTSGCVRASIVDAFSHGFEVFVVEDCCFDRSWFAHCSNLFDMNAKYATVLTLQELTPMVRAGRRSDGSQTQVSRLR